MKQQLFVLGFWPDKNMEIGLLRGSNIMEGEIHTKTNIASPQILKCKHYIDLRRQTDASPSPRNMGRD